MTLKTLKDFEWTFPDNEFRPNPKQVSFQIKETLRQESINWIKWLEENSKIEILLKETRSSDLAYQVVIDKESLKRADAEAMHRLRDTRIAASDWIKHFFNITEEDLK